MGPYDCVRLVKTHNLALLHFIINWGRYQLSDKQNRSKGSHWAVNCWILFLKVDATKPLCQYHIARFSNFIQRLCQSCQIVRLCSPHPTYIWQLELDVNHTGPGKGKYFFPHTSDLPSFQKTQLAKQTVPLTVCKLIPPPLFFFLSQSSPAV